MVRLPRANDLTYHSIDIEFFEFPHYGISNLYISRLKATLIAFQSLNNPKHQTANLQPSTLNLKT